MSSTVKLYCYVDETGQDTGGKLFVVVVVMADKERNKLIKYLERVEKESEKKKFKWTRTRNKKKNKYLGLALSSKYLKGKVFYQIFKGTKDYKDLVSLTIAQAISTYIKKHKIINYKATIVVDGLLKSERLGVSKTLGSLGVRRRKIRGARDENSSLIRLADAMAGFVRDALEGNKSFANIRNDAETQKVLNEL